MILLRLSVIMLIVKKTLKRRIIMSTLKDIHQPVKASSEVLNKKYSSSVSNILLVIAFTLLNIILLFTNSYTYFLFS